MKGSGRYEKRIFEVLVSVIVTGGRICCQTIKLRPTLASSVYAEILRVYGFFLEHRLLRTYKNGLVGVCS